MKKSFYILVSALVLFACQKQEVINNEEVTHNPTEEENIFSLSVSMPETRTNIAGADNIQFEKDETLAIIADGDNIVTLTAQSTGRAVTFEGNIGANTISDGATIVYPASFLNASKKVVYPASGGPSHIVPMAGTVVKTEGGASAKTANATLKHIGGIVKVAIADMPSIATAFTFSAKNNGSAVAITGTYDLSFNSDGEPELSNAASTGTQVSFSVSGGENEFYVPIPAQECDALTVNVMEGANTLFTKTSERGESTFGERASFLGLKKVNIIDGVYLKSSMTNWNEDNVAPMTSEDNLEYKIKLNSIGDEYAKVYVKFHGDGSTPVWRRMGPGDSNSETPSSTDLVVDDANSVHISNLGSYNFKYKVSNGNLAITSSGDSFKVYIHGNFNNWKWTSNGVELQQEGTWYYYVGKTISGAFKVFYNAYENSQLCWSSDDAWAPQHSLANNQHAFTNIANITYPAFFAVNMENGDRRYKCEESGAQYTGQAYYAAQIVAAKNNNSWGNPQTVPLSSFDGGYTYYGIIEMDGDDGDGGVFALQTKATSSNAFTKMNSDSNFTWKNEASCSAKDGNILNNYWIHNGTFLMIFDFKNYKYASVKFD